MLPDTLDLTLRVSEQQESATIERVWLDTTRPQLRRDAHAAGPAARLPRRDARRSRCRSTMPTQATGPLTLLVSDAPTLTTLEQRELRPGKPPSVARAARADERRAPQQPALRAPHHVRRRARSSAAQTLPALPASVRSVLDADKSVVVVARRHGAVVGAWEQRLDRVVRGSRETHHHAHRPTQ